MTTAHDAAARLVALRSFQGKYRVLHLTWLAFFLTFVVWFNFAPFATTISSQLGLSGAQLGTLALCNVALTIPARVLIGMVLDRFGPRRVFAGILLYAAVPCTAFALADTFGELVVSRLALGIVGAGFVVGIRMVAEWFPPSEVGMAEGVYGGWGNFGAAAAAFALPLAASIAGGEDGWRWAAAVTGWAGAAYGVWYLRAVRDTPDGVAFVRPRRASALEVSSRPAVWGLIALTAPMTAVLILIAARLRDAEVLSSAGMTIAVLAVLALAGLQVRQVLRVNRAALAGEPPVGAPYPFRSVAVLCLAYACTFGSELAVVSMLPAFVERTWDVSPAAAGAIAGVFALMNLVGRPAGGLFSDLFGSRRRTLRIILAALAAGYGSMALLGPAWPVWPAMLLIMVAACFPSAGNGAVYAITPLVSKRVSGQISGLVGAYGNVGAVLFLSALLVAPPRVFFLILAGTAVLGCVACRWLVEPQDSFATSHAPSDAAESDAAAPGQPLEERIA